MLWIDISPEDHERRKVFAALKGQGVKGSVLHRTLGDAPGHIGLSDDDVIEALTDFLRLRVKRARLAFRHVCRQLRSSIILSVPRDA
jgi:hypothetical protein